MLHSPPGVRGTPGAWDGDGRYPCELVSGSGVARIHKTGRLAPPSPRTPSPNVEANRHSPFFGPALKRTHHAPNYCHIWSTKGGEGDITGGSLPPGPSETIAGPLGNSQLLMVLQGGPLVPCHIPQLILHAGSFMWVNFKGSSKLYLCKQCKKLNLQPGLYGISLPSWAPWDLSSLFPMWIPQNSISMAGGFIICYFIKYILNFTHLNSPFPNFWNS